MAETTVHKGLESGFAKEFAERWAAAWNSHDPEPFLSPDAPRAVLYWKATGTFTGPLEPPGFAPTGARAEFDGFDLHDYRDGRVSRLRIVFDMADISRQVGLLPKQGSGFEKAGASAQRLAIAVRNRLQR